MKRIWLNCKNSSTAVTAAVKLARAYTERHSSEMCRTALFSFDDWFIGSTNIPRGITKDTIKLTKKFHYNDIQSLKQIKKYKNKIACVILEPSSTECPKLMEKITHCVVESQNVMKF